MSNRGQIFKTVAGKKPRTNVFDLSHEKKLSGNMGELIPIYVQECLPSDRFRVQSEMLIRLAPLMAPIMHRVNAYIHYFFVPNRLVCDYWQDFITGGVDGKNTNVVPYADIDNASKTNLKVGSLCDYMGLPVIEDSVTMTGTMRINVLPLRAYHLIYNEYYRDQTLTPESVIDKGENTTDGTIFTLKRRQWEKDYFSAAQIKSQRGDDVMIPMSVNYNDITTVYDDQGNVVSGGPISADASGRLSVNSTTLANPHNINSLDATVNDLRTSIVLQQWLEKNMRAGSRYVESILSHFGKRVPDYRLQRPEYIGGGKQPIVISEVLSQFESAETAQGKQTGHGISVGNQAGFNYTADEHGYILGILSVIPRTCYYQGVPRHFMKRTKFDFAYPEFAHLGEQEVWNDEIYFDPAIQHTNQVVFGYVPRYSEYRYTPDSVHGEFRTNLEFWHLGRKFDSQPTLNNSFTECVPDTRIFAVQDESVQKLWIQIYNSVRAIRPLPVYGTPML